MEKVSFAIVLDKRRERQDGTYPLKLRTTHQRRRYYSYVNIKLNPEGERVDGLTEKEYKEVYDHPKRKQNSYVLAQFKNIIAHAEETLTYVEPFNFQQFNRLLYGNGVTGEVFGLFQTYIDDLRSEGRYSTYESYRSALRSFKKFKADLKFQDITKEFLMRYQRWMIEEENKSLTTVGIYCRNLRAIFNQAKDLKLTKQYPFHNSENPKGYKIPAGRNIKKALTLDEIKKLFEYKPENDQEQYYLDLWLLSYLTNGANMKDMALWRYKNMDGDKIRWYRSKTIRTSQANSKLIEAQLGDHSKNILARYLTKDPDKDKYILPILPAGVVDEEKIVRRVKQVTKQTNKYLRRIAQKVGIEKNVTTNFTRHSYATVLINKGHNPSSLSDNLGHHSLNTTEHYVGTLPTEIKQKQVEDLTDFGAEIPPEDMIFHTKEELLERIKNLESLIGNNESKDQER